MSGAAAVLTALAFEGPALETVIEVLQPRALAAGSAAASDEEEDGASVVARPVVTPITDSVLFPAPPAQTPLPELPFGEPRPRAGETRQRASLAAKPKGSEASVANASAFIARVYERPYAGASSLALLRRGGLLDVVREVRGHGCRGGDWYRVAPAGYVCTRRGFRVHAGDQRYGYVSDAPDTSQPRPYVYGKLARQGAPLLRHVPSAEEWRQIERELAAREQGSRHRPDYPDVVRKELHGAYFFALASEEERDGRRWLHTLRGRVLPGDAVERLPVTRMRGEHLRAGQPVAFVLRGETPVLSEQTLEPVGTAERYARFPIEGQRALDGVMYVRVAGGYLVAREDVRRVRPAARPDRIDQDERWVHIDLAEQVLVAYEGDVPVFATLVASGIEGHETPTGLYRVGEKHVSTTMRGPDPDMGIYEVQEVPWTQFFSGDYALHGAYWHDAFGDVRSHGCVNVTPADARWLFHWTSPARPEVWHSMRGLRGTHVYVTR